MTGGLDQRRCGARKACRIGVVPDQPAILHHDGVDRSHGRCCRRELVEQPDNGLLIGKGDVDAGEAQPSHALEHHGQFGATCTRNLDQLVVAAQSQSRRSLLMHGG